MDGWLVGAALLSALLHAAWNAAVRASADPAQAMTAQMVFAALLLAPVVAWSGLPPSPAWPWIAASTLLNIGAVHSLLNGYRHAGFGVVYPMARASSVLLVLPMAAAIAGELPSAAGIAGVVLVSAAVALLALGGKRLTAVPRRGLLWTLAAAAFIAGYVVADAQGVRRSPSPLAYGAAVSIANALVWSWLQRSHSGGTLAMLARQAPRALPMAAAASVSYLLILWAWQHAPIALAAALRDTSAIFALLIAALVLKEPLDRRAIAAVVLATAGTVLIRLG